MHLQNTRSPQNYPYSNTYQNVQQPDYSNQKPIMRLMRQQNSYLLQQQQLNKSQISNQSSSFKNLKQFQRSLQKQRPPQIEIPMSSSKKSSKLPSVIPSNIPSPKSNVKQKFVTSLLLNQSTIHENPNDYDQAFEHRSKQTKIYGNNNLQKIKNLIVDQKPSKSPRSPRRKKQQLYSYNGSSSIDKLHKQSLKIQSDRRDWYVKKNYGDQMRQIKPFKVDNPMSLYLLDKRNQRQGPTKSLYERSLQFMKKQEQAVKQKQRQKQQQRIRKQQQEYQQMESFLKQKFSEVATKQRQQKFYQEMVQRQKLKNQLKQKEKLMHLKQITRQKPYVTPVSQALFNKILQKGSLSRNFVDRNAQYMADRQQKKFKEIKKYDEQYCPFAPKISQASRQLAQKYHQRKQREKAQKALLQKKSKSKSPNKSPKKSPNKSPVKPQSKKSPNKNTSKTLQTHQRTASAHQLGKKPTNLVSNFRQKQNVPKQKQKQIPEYIKQKTPQRISFQHQPKQEQIPIYNRLDYNKRRNRSCYNIICNK